MGPTRKWPVSGSMPSNPFSPKSSCPGHAADSALYKRVAGVGDVARMPMGGRLADDQITTLKAWIDQGAEWPDTVGANVTATKTHWAFIPPVASSSASGAKRELGPQSD